MPIDSRSYLVAACGWMFVALAMGTSLILRRRANSTAVRLWTLAMLALGMGAMLLALRDQVPRVLSYTGANVVLASAIWLKAMALRAWVGAPLRIGLHALLVLVQSVLFHTFLVLDMPAWRTGIGQVAVSAGGLYTAWWALQVASLRGSRSARSMVWFEAVPSVVLLSSIAVRLYLGQPLVNSPVPWALWLWVATMYMGNVLSTASFSGLVLDDLRQAEREARGAEQLQAGRREAAEAHARELAAAAESLRQLADERARLLALITHEVRQPLHNASGVLQSLSHALQRTPVPSSAELGVRVVRADAVLGRVRDVLDNVLVASLLLEADQPLATQRLDLRLALELALLDLTDEQRGRVRLCTEQAPEEITAELNLMRLALRNLLRNACEHGGPQARVTLRARTEPGSGDLLIEVCDDGPGFAPEALPRLAALHRATRLQLADQGTGRGLGLQVVARVAQRHGATLTLFNGQAAGLPSRAHPPEQAGTAAMADTPGTPGAPDAPDAHAANGGQGACARLRWPMLKPAAAAP